MNNIRYKEALTTAREWYSGLSTKGKIALGCFAVVNLACAFVVVIFHGRITALVLDYAETLRQSGWRGRALFGVLLSVVSFPPLAGFSTLAILVGAVYGWNGIFLVGTVASVMSTLSMVTCRVFLQEKAKRLVALHPSLQVAVSAITNESTSFLEETFALLLVKLSPLPYSLTNGALACVPGLNTWTFLIACIISSPKYLLHIFMGIQLASIGEGTPGSIPTSVRLLFLIGTGAAFAALSALIYKRLTTMAAQRGEGEDQFRDTHEPSAIPL
ncbi:unnamed protein product [Pichia kudriavzevii]